MEYIPVIVIIVVIIAILVALSSSGHAHPSTRKNAINRSNDPVKAAGKQAELYSTDIIKSALKSDDILLTNVEIQYQDKPAELDDVVVNQYGVFIIEVKYYNGELKGKEDDFEWTKTHVTEAGNSYVKPVKNPIVQVKRQIHILANYLRDNGFNVWVKGYVLLLDNKSPVQSDYILTSITDIKNVLHTVDRKTLDKKTIESIKKLLSHK